MKPMKCNGVEKEKMKNTDDFDIINKYGKEYGYYSDIVKMLKEQMNNL